ncbi:DUF821 domain protein [Hyaloscypha variabilis F]|uniref:DUF821 domain protein n=1 Tax=Hyaloscypha variabilis (strain UAMH 11265 / GT02V1 / F) TaxID=1149755 RepID=A0A2J6RRX2_HYAVF|nr:DUF821 domain protein [Hyaloscypha variabilis F]
MKAALSRVEAFMTGSTNRRRPGIFYAAPAFGLSLLFLWFWINRPHEQPVFYPPPRPVNAPEQEVVKEDWDFVRDARNLLMTDARCDEAFPELYKEINRAVEVRKGDHVTSKELDKIMKVPGYMRVMIYDQQLYILDVAEVAINLREQATLHAIHRALITSPEPLPNIEFVFMSDDIAAGTPEAKWAYSRQSNETANWLMPDFGYWSWPEPKIGSYLEVQMKATAMDAKLSWKKKTNKLLWRGASMELLVREQLVNASRGHEWADVKIFSWEEEGAKDSNSEILTMDQHCAYKYVAHTEGVSYSARLQNLQNCNSVIVSHKLRWLQHHHHLMVSSGPNQNFVEVDADFGNLAETMEGLLARDEESERIARNSVRVFKEHYLTPAAETCYWRKLVRGYASVSFEPEFFDSKGAWRGLPVESYVLERKLTWKPH